MNWRMGSDSRLCTLGLCLPQFSGPGSSVGIATELRAGRSGDRIPVGARFSVPVQTGPGAHPASCIVGTGSLPGVKSGRNVTLTPHPLLVPWSSKSRAIPLLPVWAVRPVQSLSACARVHFSFLSTAVYISALNYRVILSPEVPNYCL